jgi:dipeptidyl-peptidase 4
MKRLAILAFTALLACTNPSENRITREDYQRAIGFQNENVVNKKAFNLHVEAAWLPDSSGFGYVEQSIAGKRFIRVSLPDLEKQDLFDHESLARLLSDSLQKPVPADDLPVTIIRFQSNHEVVINVEGTNYVLETDSVVLSPSGRRSYNSTESTSPNGKWVAFSKDYNLYIRSAQNGREKQLSSTGSKNYEYASWYGWGDIMEGENGERPSHFSLRWSDDSEWIQTNVCDLRTASKMYLLDWSVDTLYRPRLLSYYRGSPGDTGMVYMEPVFFNVKTGKEVRPQLPRSTHINTVNVVWSSRPGVVYLAQQTRGFKDMSIYTFDLASEKLELLYHEASPTNIDTFDHELLEDEGKLIIYSEKSGWRQLHSIDLVTKQEKMITGGGFYVHDIKHFDPATKHIFFTASGKEPDANPYYQNLYSISLDGSEARLLTPEATNHNVSMSPDGKYFVDNYSTVNTPTQTVLRSAATGEILLPLAEATLNGLDDWSAPEIFTALARDEKTTIYGAIWKPTDFNPSKKYPVIELSYTGPHTQLFPREFSRAFMLQSYAELGFVAIVVDGLGSSGRSKEFHNYSYKNLGGNLADHVRAIQQLGEKYKWIDTSKVGVFGHSAGGYDAAHAVLAYPEVYKVAVASSADHDHRMEKAWWPEMYMGWPVDSAYHLQSNITMAPNLKGKLLITHGGIDENVNPSATFKLAEALIKADKQFDMLILPSQHHGYQGDHSKYFNKVRWNYFIKHLRGVEPLWDFE